MAKLSAVVLSAVLWKTTVVEGFPAKTPAPNVLNIPMQTYYVPLPEEKLLESFVKISSDSQGPVHSFVSIAVAAAKTVIWYDHAEDGYEVGAGDSCQSSTEVWGDGDASNGCAPGVDPCTDLNDYFERGDAIVLENSLATGSYSYNGGDKISASSAIAVTRGGYPDTPGTLLAGAVEVWETFYWGNEFVSPIGPDSIGLLPNSYIEENKEAFEHVSLYVMARNDNTEVTFGGTTLTLNEGECHVLEVVNQGDRLTASDDVQVHIVSGNIGSIYEMRWYSLLPLKLWSNKYYSPVGSVVADPTVDVNMILNDSERETRIWLFNPSETDSIVVRCQTTGSEEFLQLAPGQSKPTVKDTINSGWECLSQGLPFFAMTQTNSQGGGHFIDWGIPLTPSNMLTSQAIISFGYGCTNNDCTQGGAEAPFEGSRSAVWVTATTKNTVVTVDYGDGRVEELPKMKKLESIRIHDDVDNDMTGAIITATKKGKPVEIAVAWGQDGSRAVDGDPSAMDLGTAVPPLPMLLVGKTCELEKDNNWDHELSPGDQVKFTIQIKNTGTVDFDPGTFMVEENFSFENAEYVPLSLSYTDAVGTNTFQSYNASLPTPPLWVGDIHQICFSVVLKSQSDWQGPYHIENTGQLVDSETGDYVATFQEKKMVSPCPLVPTVESECQPLLVSGTGGVQEQVGTVCAKVVHDHLEIKKEITKASCCMTECHICNLPTKTFSFGENMCQTGDVVPAIGISEVYDFTCAFDEDCFSVLGHATVVCDGMELNSYFEIPLLCSQECEVVENGDMDPPKLCPAV